MYTVTADDGTAQKYTITVESAASDEKAITSLKIGSSEGVIIGNSIVVTVPYRTDLTKLAPVIAVAGSSVNPLSGAVQDFSNPVMYTVTADDATTQDYTVFVRHAASDEKLITSFRIGSSDGVITGDTISVTVPSDTEITQTSPTITITGRSVSPASGVKQNFTPPITYTVTADDGSTAEYTVTVIVQGKAAITIQGPGEEDISITGFTGDSPVLSRSGKNDLPKELIVSVSDTYTSCAWYIDGVLKTGDTGHENQISIKSSDYSLKKHYITVVIYKADIPYSREFIVAVDE
jgi:hypothetical protein